MKVIDALVTLTGCIRCTSVRRDGNGSCRLGADRHSQKFALRFVGARTRTPSALTSRPAVGKKDLRSGDTVVEFTRILDV